MDLPGPPPAGGVGHQAKQGGKPDQLAPRSRSSVRDRALPLGLPGGDGRGQRLHLPRTAVRPDQPESVSYRNPRDVLRHHVTEHAVAGQRDGELVDQQDRAKRCAHHAVRSDQHPRDPQRGIDHHADRWRHRPAAGVELPVANEESLEDPGMRVGTIPLLPACAVISTSLTG